MSCSAHHLSAFLPILLVLGTFLGVVLPAVWSTQPTRRHAAAQVLAQLLAALRPHTALIHSALPPQIHTSMRRIDQCCTDDGQAPHRTCPVHHTPPCLCRSGLAGPVR
ncbi:hypothetical protein DSC45_23725 [Streptomyces sp. YIM 130001]|nr:hypothetical protein DSC45_23725 [Streptomyces sp. YIM 130001]